MCGFCTVDGKARSLEQFALVGGEFDAAALLTRAGGEARTDIDEALSAAALAAGHEDLDFFGIFERVFKQGGIDIPPNLAAPRVRREP